MQAVTVMVNLGSPRTTDPDDVRAYLDEFLMDKRVIDVPAWLRSFIVRGIILRTRPKRTAAAYKRIWWDEGSPLIAISERLAEKVRQHSTQPVYLAMRYGLPSIEDVLHTIREDHPDLQNIQLLPMYPHYAMSTYETVVVKVQEEANRILPGVKLKVRPVFYNDRHYIRLLADSFRPHLENGYSHLLLSYHGVPERHVRKCDVTGAHCLKVDHCCQKPSPAHAYCYRHQCYRTSELVIGELGIDPGKASVSFQSRLGIDPWLKPYTDHELERRGKEGIEHLVVACPAFVTDCLETLEEIHGEGRELFLKAGGKHFSVIPCLNDRTAWIELIVRWIGDKTQWLDVEQVVRPPHPVGG